MIVVGDVVVVGVDLERQQQHCFAPTHTHTQAPKVCDVGWDLDLKGNSGENMSMKCWAACANFGRNIKVSLANKNFDFDISCWENARQVWGTGKTSSKNNFFIK